MDRRRTMMNAFRKVLIGMGALAVVALGVELAAPRSVHAVVSALVTVANAPSNPVPTINVAQSPSENVELRAQADHGQTIPFTSLGPDGTPSTSPFEVPDGQVLVITDVDLNPIGAGVGGVNLLVLQDAATGNYREVWLTMGPATLHLSYHAGIIVSSGASLNLINYNGTGTVTRVNLHGYLTPGS
jgi:hypothetical protein